MDKKKDEREISEKEINEHLDKLINSEGHFDNPSHIIRFLAKIVYNVRYDMVELDKHIYEYFKSIRPVEYDGDSPKPPIPLQQPIQRTQLWNDDVGGFYI